MNRRRRLLFPPLSFVNFLFFLILLLSAFLRLYRLDEIPPGVTHDEADTGYFFAAVARGAPSPVEAPYGYAYEPLPMYTGALFIRVFGPTILALRLHSAFFGMLTLIMTYLWARRAFGPAVGLGGAALLGFSFWTVADSRFALNSQPVTTLFTGAVYALWLALEADRRRLERWVCWGLFSLLLAGSLYVYEAARGAAGIFVLFLAGLALFDRTRFRHHGPWLAGALLLAGALAAPHLLDPGAWGRTNTLSGPIQAALRGDLAPLLANVVSGLGTFSVRGDSLVTYNLPGRPIFDPVVSLFFYLGIVTGVFIVITGTPWSPGERRWSRSAYAFTLLWLVGGILPTLLLGAYTSTLHSKLAEPPIMILPALGAVGLGRWLHARFGPRWRNGFAAACVLWLGVVAGTTGYDYFVRWGESPETRAAYFHNLAAIADCLNQTLHDEVVTLSSPFPDLPLDPFIADMTIHRQNVALRWCDARRAIVLPDIARGRLILPPNTPLAPYFARRLDLQLVQRVHLRPTDIDPYFDVFTWQPRIALAAFVQPTTGEFLAGDARLRLPVNFGGAVELLGVDMPTSADEIQDASTTLVTTWRVLDPAALGPPPPHDYGHAVTIFVHALDDAGAPIDQEDRLDAPAWNWHASDVFVQIHRLKLTASVAPQRLAIGLYTKHNQSRLPVLVNGGEGTLKVLADHLILVYPEQSP